MSTAQPTGRAARSIEDFRGDYEELAAVMEESWGENETDPFLYTAEFLQDCFRYPAAEFSFAPAIYRGGELVAFVAGFPRRIHVQGAERQVLIVALLTVARAYRSSGYGIVVWSELVRRAAAGGFDGVVNYCVEGEAMNRMIEGCCKRVGVQVVRAASLPYASRLLWPKQAETGGEPCSAAPELLLKVAARGTDQAALSRVWTSEEAAWQLARHEAVCVQAGTEASPALLTGYVMPVADRRRTRCLIVEDIFWGDLAPDAREGLVAELMVRAAAAGARVAILPSRGYADEDPFRAAGFKPSQKTIHAYLTLWNGSMPTAPVSGYYLDVF